MGDRTGIGWTEATWNPVTGCTEVSAGCDRCYAKSLAERFRGVAGHYFTDGFDVVLRPSKLDQPTRWTKPRMIFVNSMSDLFHDDVEDDFIARAWAVMATSAVHTFQILTKRHARMRSLLSSEAFRAAVIKHRAGYAETAPARPMFGPDAWPLPNVWIGVSVENQRWADIRIPHLLRTPAALRFLSCEPLLGRVDLQGGLDWHLAGTGADGASGIGWVIAGGESGPGARLMDPGWARLLRDQCAVADVPFFFKQAGSRLASRWGVPGKGEDPECWPEHFPQEHPVRPDVAAASRAHLPEAKALSRRN
jgi:protein gp37